MATYEAQLVIRFEADDDEAARRTVEEWLRRETGRNGQVESVTRTGESGGGET